jgi:phytoene desaturase
MNYADISLGTWYPMGGMFKFIEAFEKIATEQGVKIITDSEVIGFECVNKKITHVKTKNGLIETDIVVSGADYQHTESTLLKGKANYSSSYWDKRTMAPSCLLFYVGLNKRVENLQHHNLFFDEDFTKHAEEIYKDPKWPTSPLFYLSVPSLTDSTVAPEGHENLFLLIPIAPDLEDKEEIREQYFELLLDRLEKKTGNSIRDNIVYKSSFSIKDFK